MLRPVPDNVDTVSTFREEEYRFTASQPYRLFRSYYDIPRSVCLHYHEAFEVLVNHDVTGTTTVAGTPFDLAHHRVIVVPPSVPHGHRMLPADGYVLCLQLSLTELSSLLDVDRLLEVSGRRALGESPFVSDGYGVLVSILSELESVDQEDVIAKVSLLLRLFGVIASVPADRTSPGREDTFLNAAISWTEQHLDEKITLADVSSHCGLSRYHFCRAFKRSTGTRYSDYLNQVRLDHAKGQLQRGATVTEAGLRSGFQNVSYFVQLFRRYTGTTPKQFQLALAGSPSRSGTE